MLIQAHDLGVRIDGRDILRGESLSCRPGTMTALVGPSGSGKTTLLHCLGLLQIPTSGSVGVDGVDTTTWSQSRRRRFWSQHAAFVLQNYGIIEDETLAFNVTMQSGRTRRGARDTQLSQALDITGLASRESETASHLSGGEKQRLAVARAIYKQATVILIDEPTASLDAENRDRVIALFAERARAGCTVIVASHDPAMTEACDHRHIVGTFTASAQPA